jgi:hypothetical protein
MTESTVTRWVVALSYCIGAVSCTACSGSNGAPTPIPSPATTSFAGTWQGSSSASFLTGRILQLEISQVAEDLTGRWTLASSPANQTLTGHITGRVIDSRMALVLTSPEWTCPTLVGGTLETDTRISGTYSTFSAVCPSGATAPIILEKQ